MNREFTDRDIASRWDAGARVWAEAIRGGKDLYREALNNPALFRLLGEVQGKRVLDLGCGEGYNTRMVARKGALVTGVDLSKELVKLAVEKERENRLGIEYCKANATHLPILDGSPFDIVVSFMAIHDMRDVKKVFSEVARVLRPKGRFLFSVPHPCFERRSERHGWQKDGEGNQLYFKVDNYLEEGPYEYEFVMRSAGMTMPRKMVSFHRTFTTYFQTLINADFHIKRIDEPVPSREMAAKHPRLKECFRIPQSLLIEAVKP